MSDWKVIEASFLNPIRFGCVPLEPSAPLQGGVCWILKGQDFFQISTVYLLMYTRLVGGFNPFEKYAGQIGSFHQVEVKIEIFETTS